MDLKDIVKITLFGVIGFVISIVTGLATSALGIYGPFIHTSNRQPTYSSYIYYNVQKDSQEILHLSILLDIRSCIFCNGILAYAYYHAPIWYCWRNNCWN